ncbi:hypothetical protein GQX74_014966 [Glossina fuscipes]|nr:hypothetical protein GQX74_014966 [Glossina fuscipes]
MPNEVLQSSPPLQEIHHSFDLKRFPYGAKRNREMIYMHKVEFHCAPTGPRKVEKKSRNLFRIERHAVPFLIVLYFNATNGAANLISFCFRMTRIQMLLSKVVLVVSAHPTSLFEINVARSKKNLQTFTNR